MSEPQEAPYTRGYGFNAAHSIARSGLNKLLRFVMVAFPKSPEKDQFFVELREHEGRIHEMIAGLPLQKAEEPDLVEEESQP